MTVKLPNKLDHPSVWEGNELFERLDWQYQLSSDDLDQLKSAALKQSDIDATTKDSFELGNFSKTLRRHSTHA